MSKVINVQLKWKYSPKEYLEEPTSISFKGGNLKIADGVAVARIDPKIYQLDSSIEEVLTQKIQNRFYATSIITHKRFDLSKPSRVDIEADGLRRQFCEARVRVAATFTANYVVRDKDGNIVLDTKRECLDETNWITSLLDKHRNDTTLEHMLESYQKSIKDPDNELIYLYDIIDSLSKRFESNKNAIKKLNITNDEWKEIGKLANDRAIKQGRHRGKGVGKLRNATTAELEKARKSAKDLIKKYLKYLET